MTRGEARLARKQETTEEKPSDPLKQRSAAALISSDELNAMGGQKPRLSRLDLTCDERRRLGARRPGACRP
jgi:hypothetical protein